MPKLHIALQEGFAGEPVTISVDGRDVYRKDQVRTRTQIGLADTVETTHDVGPATIDVKAKSAAETIKVSVDGDLYLALSLSPDGRIVYRTSAQPFRYM